MQSLLIHLLASGLFSLFHVAFYALAYQLALIFGVDGIPPVSYPERFQRLLSAYLHFCLMSYWGILAVAYAVNYYRAFQERKVRAAQLETSLLQSHLQILTMQLHPHFLFNTLNTISELVHEDAEAADKMIALLSGLLRISLETTGLQQITLKRELDFLQKYLDIQKIRFAERLTIDIKIEPETYDALVPSMFLQPLVENAIFYAIAPREAGGRIEIVSERKNNKLYLKIEDDGQTLKPNEKIVFQEGLGIKNTRERLERLYGEVQTLNFTASAGGGLVVKIEIPFVEDFNGGKEQ